VSAYQRASTDLEVRRSLSNSAVSGSQDGVGVEEGGTTEVASRTLEGDDEGEVACGSGDAANDVVGAVIVPVGDLRVLGDSCREDNGRERERGNEVLDLHLEEDGDDEVGWEVMVEVKLEAKDLVLV
jgi:hypothetical protein